MLLQKNSLLRREETRNYQNFRVLYSNYQKNVEVIHKIKLFGSKKKIAHFDNLRGSSNNVGNLLLFRKKKLSVYHMKFFLLTKSVLAAQKKNLTKIFII